MRILLNSAPASLFCATGDERDKLVALGRMLMSEANGRTLNSVRKNSKHPYAEKMDANEYSRTNENTKQRLMLFCAEKACAMDGREKPESYQAFLSRSRDYFSNPVFMRALSGVVEDIVRPMLPYVLSNAVDELGQMVSVPLGQTYEISVASNDIFLFQDSSWGASRSVPANTLYNYPITLNPTPRTAEASVKWYQLVGNDADFGMWLNALTAGLYSKIMALWTNAMTTASANNMYVPSYLKFTSYNSANLAKAVTLVATANHVRRDQVMVYGAFQPLTKILPSGTSQDAALTYGLGAEWMRNGYLGTVMGTPVFELLDAMAPGTQNTTGGLVLPQDRVWIAARKGVGYAPVYIAFEDGTPITLELTPDKTADMTLNVNITASMDVKAVFGSKVATISGIS